MYVHICHTHLYNWIALSFHLHTAVSNNCFSKVTAYIALAYSFRLISMMYCLAQRPCLPQLPYKTCRTSLTNHMGSISHHTRSLIINSLRGEHTCTPMHTCRRLHKNHLKKPSVYRPTASVSGLKTDKQVLGNWFLSLLSLLKDHITYLK